MQESRNPSTPEAPLQPPPGPLTPLMQQYWEIKKQHPDKILLFRMGDFFEMFYRDAEVAAPLLNIALTARNRKAADETPMCGVPHHSVAGPIARLLAAGLKVAICDQIEDPKEAVGIVRRAVTRVLTPGMVYDPETLDQITANYLCGQTDAGVGFLDITTGEAFYYLVGPEEQSKLITILRPVEVVVCPEKKAEVVGRTTDLPYLLTAFEGDRVATQEGNLPDCAQILLDYVGSTQGLEILRTIRPFVARNADCQMEISPVVLRHLEIFETSLGEKKGSLFHAIDRTQTPAGGRLLRDWLTFPLRDLGPIENRRGRVAAWVDTPDQVGRVRDVLAQMGDIERRLAKVAGPQGSPRDMVALGNSLAIGLSVAKWCEGLDATVAQVAKRLLGEIERTISDEPSPHLKVPGFIRADFSPDLKGLIDLSQGGKERLLELEARERAATQIPSLKVKYNNVFGYFLEITNVHREKVPDHYKRKQTLANAERYVIAELTELEEKLLSAETRRLQMEHEIFAGLKRLVLAAATEIRILSRALSELDVILALAWLAIEQRYVRPTTSASGGITLLASRHPVVEQQVRVPFVANDVILPAGGCLLLTGPNMAGKSTLMRQVALAAIMAQIGSFVPARKAELPLFDQIFTRIGASDYLAEGLSTFMVEMQETAQMLNSVTERSLVILDEVGRGTSTYDGMSLAQAILEHLLRTRKPTTFFATHYHELTRLERDFPMIQNAHMSIRERAAPGGGVEIQFLHTLRPGPAGQSYGVHVAKLAGLPASVLRRATQLLAQHETFQGGPAGQMSFLDLPVAESAFSQELRQLDLSQLTPLEALNQIAKWQAEAGC